MNRTILLVTGALLTALFLFAEYTWRQQVLAEADPGERVAVLAAVRPLAAGASLQPAMVHIVREGRRILERSPDAIRVDDLNDYVGRELRRPLALGELLRESDFASTEKRRLSDIVHGQRRGVAVQVDALNSFGGLLRPGDRVDVLATLMHYDKKALVTRPLLHRVEVLAVGDRLVGDEDAPSSGSRGTVTLDVEPSDALRLKHIEKTGDLVFLLRNPTDQVPMAHVDEVDHRELVTPVPDAPRRRRQKPTSVEVYP